MARTVRSRSDVKSTEWREVPGPEARAGRDRSGRGFRARLCDRSTKRPNPQVQDKPWPVSRSWRWCRPDSRHGRHDPDCRRPRCRGQQAIRRAQDSQRSADRTDAGRFRQGDAQIQPAPAPARKAPTLPDSRSRLATFPCWKVYREPVTRAIVTFCPEWKKTGHLIRQLRAFDRAMVPPPHRRRLLYDGAGLQRSQA